MDGLIGGVIAPAQATPAGLQRSYYLPTVGAKGQNL
jgi:hypothetical protein